MKKLRLRLLASASYSCARQRWLAAPFDIVAYAMEQARKAS